MSISCTNEKMEVETESQPSQSEKRVAEEYLSSLSDLTWNSKPLINMLTMLAEENIDYAPVIVKVVEEHLSKAPAELKLPLLYLIDSIVKNVKGSYIALFSQCIIRIFCGAFEMANEKIRERMFALRQTWNEVFSPQKLYTLDVKVQQLDRNWPITSKPQPSIHVNPNFLKAPAAMGDPTGVQEILHAKTRELLQLKKRKLELELEATKKQMEEQEKQIPANVDGLVPPGEEVVPQEKPMYITKPVAAGIVAGTPALPRPRPTILVNPNALIMGNRVPPMDLIRAQKPLVAGGVYNQQPNVPPMQSAETNLAIMQQQLAYPPHATHPAVSRSKVHPINPVMLNSIRPRDPRLLKQQQQQQLSKEYDKAKENPRQMESHADYGKQSRSNADEAAGNGSSSRYRSRSSRESSDRKKSPIRHHSSSSRSSSSRHSSKSSSYSGSKHSDSKRSSDRDKKSLNKAKPLSPILTSQDNKALATNCDKDAFEIAPLSLIAYDEAYHASGASSNKRSRDSSKRSIESSPKAKVKSDPRSDSSMANGDIDLRPALQPTQMQAKSASALSSPSRINKSHKIRRKTEADSDHSDDNGNNNSQSEHKEEYSDEERIVRRKQYGDRSETSANESNKKAVKSLDKTKTSATTQQTAATSTTTSTSSSSSLSTTTATATTTTTTATGTATIVSNTKSSAGWRIPRSHLLHPRATDKSAYTVEDDDEIDESGLNHNDDHDDDYDNNNDSDNSVEMMYKDNTAETTNSKNSPQKQQAKNRRTHKHDGDTAAAAAGGIIGKKRSSNASSATSSSSVMIADDEPQPKKSKTSTDTASASTAAKLDALFGSEDVDYRTVLPSARNLMQKKQSEDEINEHAGGSAPVITSSEEDSPKSKKSKRNDSKAPPNLDDVRAKLAKTARMERLQDRQRQRLMEIEATNDDISQEANEGKIRLMISQAQELYKNKTINKEQYINVMQTVMTINENNKIQEAKKRESSSHSSSLVRSMMMSPEGNAKMKLGEIASEEAVNDRAMVAAREAVMKKRIPKISKMSADLADSSKQLNAAGSNSPAYDNNNDDKMMPESMQVDDNAKGLPEVGGGGGSAVPKKDFSSMKASGGGGGRGGERRVSKWSNRVDENINSGPQFTPAPGVGVGPPQRGNWILGGGPMLHNNNNKHQRNLGNWPKPGGNNVNNMMPVNKPMEMGLEPMPLIRNVIPPPPQPPISIPQIMLPVPETQKNLPRLCNSVDNPKADLVRSIMIDNVNKDIRIYDDIAIVFMDSDMPCEIGFQSGKRTIQIDDMEPFELHFNDDTKTIVLDGLVHRIRFGFPSRELYIDDHWYEACFGKSKILIPINNKLHTLFVSGPAPNVRIGRPRLDLVAGRIHMIIDAVNLIPLYLDARIQKFLLGDAEHTVQFADCLLTVILDGEPKKIEYGGIPQCYKLGQQSHYIRFTTLPKHVIPGEVFIKDMIFINLNPAVVAAKQNANLKTEDTAAAAAAGNSNINSNADLKAINAGDGGGIGSGDVSETKPITTKSQIIAEDIKTDTEMTSADAGNADASAASNAASANVKAEDTSSIPLFSTNALNKINIDDILQKLALSGFFNNNSKSASGEGGSSGGDKAQKGTSSIIADIATNSNDATTTAAGLNSNNNSKKIDAVNAITSAIVDDSSQTSNAKKEEIPEPEPIIPIDLSRPESIKTRQLPIIAALYSGMQCSSCGVRFQPEQTLKYSQHLDWHFRQNRRGRDSSRKAQSRKWYYELNDWLQYEEIEDCDEREKNFFETQQNEVDIFDDGSNQRSVNSPLPTCPAGPEEIDHFCDMCHEKFEQFYNEDLEEWHLRGAIRVDDQFYHPLCYDDYKASLVPQKMDVTDPDDNATDMVIAKPKDGDNETDVENTTTVTINDDDDDDDVAGGADGGTGDGTASKNAKGPFDDDDDDVIVLPNEDRITEISDDDDEEEYVPKSVTKEQMGRTDDTKDEDNDDAMESDVEIQEPLIPFQDLDNYVEKELPVLDESTQAALLNVKIKEEPKDEEDEDDAFEDVGTVLIAPDEEISIQSSSEAANTIRSSIDSPAMGLSTNERPSSVISIAGTPIRLNEETSNMETVINLEDTPDETANNITLDGNLEANDVHNLSSVGGPPQPAVTLLNKIKINITKSTTNQNAGHNSTNSNSSSGGANQTNPAAATNNATTTTTTATSSLSSNNTENNNNENVGLTIPVLCGGTANINKPNNLSVGNVVSSISVIGGSYGNNNNSNSTTNNGNTYGKSQNPLPNVTTSATTSLSSTHHQNPPEPPKTPPIEDTITYELKPALKNVPLKKMKKIVSGTETSGLCSIM